MRGRWRHLAGPTTWFAFAATVLATAVYGSHVANAAFFNDSWGMYLTGRSGATFADQLESYGWMSFRPLGWLYWPATFEVFGLDPRVHAAWTIACAVGASVALFALLRELGVRSRRAAPAGLVALLIPVGDATRLWAGASSNTLAVALWLAGATVALRAFASDGRHRLVLHGLSVALVLMSGALYEVAAPLMVLSAALYRLRTSWREALSRGAIDAVIGVTALAWAATNSIYEPAPLGEVLDRTGPFAGKVAQLIVRSAFPFGPMPTALGVALLAAVLAAAVVVVLVRRDRVQAVDLRRTAVVIALGASIMACGWALVLPSPFDPLGTGQFNRVNNLAGYGIVLVLLAGAGLVGQAAGSLVRRPHAGATAAVALTAVLLGAGWTADVRRHAEDWRRAADEQRRVLSAVDRALPDGGPWVVFTFGHAIEAAPGIPILAAPWDIAGALSSRYGERIRGFVMLPGTTLTCGPSRVRARNNNDKFVAGTLAVYGDVDPDLGQSASYEKALFVDVAAGRSAVVRSRQSCLRLVGAFAPGPQTLGPART